MTVSPGNLSTLRFQQFISPVQVSYPDTGSPCGCHTSVSALGVWDSCHLPGCLENSSFPCVFRSPRRVVRFSVCSVCSAFHLLLRGRGDFQASRTRNQKLQMHFSDCKNQQFKEFRNQGNILLRVEKNQTLQPRKETIFSLVPLNKVVNR